ncbi:alpha/beta hydrolase [Streptomyces sp. NPDC093094]|uniref:alpha/beta hydrolase n=1 Tax=Streptomyces sp. NPDC093094 TaxID=3366026 RepID=UPI00382CA6BE
MERPGRTAGRSRPRRPHRWRRALLAALVTGAVVVPLSAAARPSVPAPAPADTGRVTAAGLEAAYAAHRGNAAQASRMAEAHGHRHRAGVEDSLAAPSRQLLFFDGRGQGRAVEVLGDLAHADRVAVLVPGSDTSLDTYGRFRAAARALHRSLTAQAPAGTGTAVVAWLGYDTPATFGAAVLTTDRADEGAVRLGEFIRTLRGLTGPRTTVALLCHSYGSVVCARAADGPSADDIVLVGSPGTGADSVADLHTRARVWAARGSGDWVADVPHIRAELLGTTVGFGTDPVSPAFGARVFTAGHGGHSDYFAPGSASLAGLTRIVLGETPEASRG